MGSLDLLLDQTRLDFQTVQISTMKILAALTLALAITNVKADGAHSYDHAPVARDSYGPPEPSYEAPADSYGAPAPSYSAPSYEPNEVHQPVDRGCIEKLTCEVGALSYDAGLTSHPYLKLVAPFVPGKYEKYVKHFISANNCQKIKCNTYS